MLKITTRLFAGGTMAALLIGINTGAFACDKCVGNAPKTAAKAKKTGLTTGAKSKIAPKSAKKSAVKLASLQVDTKGAAKMCPKCEKEAASAKK